MPVAYPCGICNKPVASNHHAILCDVRCKWIHIKCNHISPGKYNEFMMEEDSKWYHF